jgi:hypothetical protein
MEEEMDGTCSMKGGVGRCTQDSGGGHLKERDDLKDLGVNGKMVFFYIYGSVHRSMN